MYERFIHDAFIQYNLGFFVNVYESNLGVTQALRTLFVNTEFTKKKVFGKLT